MENNKAQKVEASKQFSVPAEQVYKAWNEPEQLTQWWKPMGNQLKEVTNDLKPGGTVQYTFNDISLIISGKYEEVKENEKLSYTWNWEFPDDAVKNAAYKLTIEFANKDNGSEIHVIQESAQDEETLQPNEEGWEKGLEDLKTFLEGRSEQQNNDQTVFEEPGYREIPEQEKVGGG